MRSFASDNNSGVHPLVMEALSRANADHALGYGDDQWTEEAVAKIKETFTPDCVPLFVFNGTGILDIPELAEKCRKREYIGKSRSYKFYQSGELIKHREDDKIGRAHV